MSDEARTTDWSLPPDLVPPVIPGYEILDRLAPGGMGVVYRARQLAPNRTVALKMILTGAHARPQERARFRVEAEAIASLSHPHIIQIHDYGEWQGMPYLAMEFAEGGSLAARLAGQPMEPSGAAELVETLARAVQFVHDQGLIHRDLKPANILLSLSGGSEDRPGGLSEAIREPPFNQCIPKLADFGLAKRLDIDQGLTQSQAILGTASYMAPEQAAGDKHALGPAADIYALGAILYEVLTGRPPFRAETPERTIHQVLNDEPLPPARLRREVPAALEAICLKCLEKEPGRRFASALALAEDLRRHRNGEPISTQAIGTFEWHTRLARRAGYEILHLRGTGARGITYKAEQLSLKRTVALTMIAAAGGLDPAQLTRLRGEAAAVAQLRHLNIVEIHDFGEISGEPYLATEYVEGGSLADAITGPAQLADQTAVLVETLARAVHHAHQQGFVHGGLKPSRVLLGSDGTCKITGFGLASAWRDEVIGPAADVYALGAILYELLCGRPPARAEASGTTPEPAHTSKLQSPRHWRPEVSPGLEAICLRCLEADPAESYPNAAALAEDLRRFRSGEVLFIDDLDGWAQQERWARRAGYEILEVLGRGGECFTYKARQVVLDRPVVLKRLLARDRFVPTVKARFRREAYLLAGLRHPNFVQLHDQGEQSDLSYFAREFVEGPSLTEQAAEAPLPARSAAELVEVLSRAIQAAHALGTIHGGLNPDDVRLTPAGLPRITSFRRAWQPGRRADDGRPESEQGRVASYLAPEQLAGGRRVLGPATDVYALGAILYTLFTGRPPFVAPTPAEVLEQVRSQTPISPRRWQAGISSELEGICLKCLEKQPGRRPASAEALAEELRRFLAQ